MRIRDEDKPMLVQIALLLALAVVLVLFAR
jgi:hypothetical protein